MDLHLFIRVLGRFRLLIAGTFLLAIMLAFLAYAKVGWSAGHPVIKYRQSEGWVQLLAATRDTARFAFGSTLVQSRSLHASDGGLPAATAGSGRASADDARGLYSRFVLSDDFFRILLKTGPVKGSVTAAR